jgi:uncharacterized delta-60 repeat protein
MKRRKSKTNAPKIRLVGWEAPLTVAVAAAGLASATALAAQGDLDPSFGNVGRQAQVGPTSSPYTSQLFSADALDDDDVVFGGGGEYCYWGCYVSYFVGRLDADGSVDPAFSQPVLPSAVSVYSTAAQPDGKLVGVGKNGSRLAVFRTLATGALDPGFGLEGIASMPEPATAGEYHGYALQLDPDGRVVAAGVANSRLMVARLESNGTPDTTFGAGGLALFDTVPVPYQRPMRIGRAVAGKYRVLINAGTTNWTCRVVGLTPEGTLDVTYGTAGVAEPRSSTDAPLKCNSMTVLGDGAVVVVGSIGDTSAQAVRLEANGAQDTTFNSSAALQPFVAATAIAASPSGKLLVGASGGGQVPGANVLRLLGDGRIDASFGQAGRATIETESTRAVKPDVTDLQVLSGERVLVAGNAFWPNQRFIARLLGDAGGGGPGVVGITGGGVLVTEQQGRATLVVRRTGGKTGAIAVSYATETLTGGSTAVAGEDFTATTGRLDWADGDSSERQIVVPVSADGVTEIPEFFAVKLSAPEGGAGLGTTGADVEVAGAGYPSGHFSISARQALVGEGTSAQFGVSRNYYSQGTVSVTVRVAPETTATKGSDFAGPGLRDQWQDVVLTWGDGQTGEKIVSVSVLADKGNDPGETLVLELASPTGGAVIDPQSKASVELVNRGSVNGGGNSGGGGQFGALGALLLAFAGALRRGQLRWHRGKGLNRQEVVS